MVTNVSLLTHVHPYLTCSVLSFLTSCLRNFNWQLFFVCLFVCLSVFFLLRLEFRFWLSHFRVYFLVHLSHVSILTDALCPDESAHSKTGCFAPCLYSQTPSLFIALSTSPLLSCRIIYRSGPEMRAQYSVNFIVVRTLSWSKSGCVCTIFLLIPSHFNFVSPEPSLSPAHKEQIFPW